MRKPIFNYSYMLRGTEDKHGENLELEIEYSYSPAKHATRMDPPEDESVEIETISLFGHDVGSWLDDMGFDLEEMKQEIIENHTENGD